MTPKKFRIAIVSMLALVLGCSSQQDGATVAIGTSSSALTSETVCQGGATTPVLVPRWFTLYDGVYADRGIVQGLVDNTGATDIPLRIDLRMAGADAREISRTLWSGTVRAGASASVSFELSTLPIRTEGIPSMAELVATVTGGEREGRTFYSTPLYATYDATRSAFSLSPRERPTSNYLTPATSTTFQDAFRQLTLNVEPLTRRVNAQVLSGSSFRPIGDLTPVGSDAYTHAQWMAISSADARTFSGLFGNTAPSIGGSYARMKVCAQYGSRFVDEGPGTTITGDRLPAAFAQAGIGRAGRLPDWSGYLDQSGCTPNITLDDYADYTMFVNTNISDRDGVLGGAHNVRVLDPTGAAESRWIGFSTLRVRRPSWEPDVVINLGGFGSGDSEMRAAGVIGRVLSNAWARQSEPGDYEIHANQRCLDKDNSYTACYSGGIVYLGANRDSTHNTQYKHVVTHEFGHAIQDRSFGTLRLSYARDADVNESGACGCGFVPDTTDRAHCLQSRQQLGAVQNEAYGHYIAANTWNNTAAPACTFVYYKTFREDSGQLVQPPVAKDCRVQARWMENHCTANNRGVEWDWLNFFRSSGVSGTPIPLSDLKAVYRRACGGTACSGSNEPTFSQLQSAAQTEFGAGTAKYNAFRAASTNYGIAH